MGSCAMLIIYSVEISLAMHSYSLFCFISLVIARALAADAFSPFFGLLKKLLY